MKINILILRHALENTPKILIIRQCFKIKRLTIVNVFTKLVWAASGEIHEADRLLVFLNLLVLFAFGGKNLVLPRQLALQEVHEQISYSLQVVSPR